MSKKNNKKNNAGSNNSFTFIGNAAKSIRNSKTINKSAAAMGSTVDKKNGKKSVTIVENNPKPKREPIYGVGRAITSSIKADQRYIHKYGRKLMNAQKREDFVESLKNGSDRVNVIGAIGEMLNGAKANVTNMMEKKKAEVALREKAMKDAQLAARGAWYKRIKPTEAEKAIIH